MSHRRLTATAAALAAAVALIPGLAYAAGSPLAVGTPDASSISALAGAMTPGLKTFTSPADKSVRTQTQGFRGAAQSRAASSGRTLYAYTTEACGVDSGTGAQNAPFCSVQDAVNAAAPGDTIDVRGDNYSGSEWDAVTIKTSGISIVGIDDQAWVNPTNNNAGKPAITLDGVSNVTISNLMLTSWGAPAVKVVNSSGVTVDSSYLSASSTPSALTIDGSSSNVTVSRSAVNTGYQSGNATGVSAMSGASNITLASNLLAASGISATDVKGLNVTGNTIQRGCLAGVDVEGSSSGVSVENNLLEDANPSTDALTGGYQSQCASKNLTWAPDVSVSTGSAAATTADYNDFYVFGSDATAPYSWAGTSYPTLGAFRAGASQGTHDTVETQQPAGYYSRPNAIRAIDALPSATSAAYASANPSAPGELSSDFYGVSPYNSRGAIQNPNPNLAVAVTGQDTSAYGASLTSTVTSSNVPLSVRVTWGDGQISDSQLTGPGQTTASHRYSKLGTYTISVTATDKSGVTATNSFKWVTAGSEYTAYGPTRLLDTRYGIGAPAAQVQPRGTARVKIAGNGGIPARVTAVVLNLTATGPTGAGYITAYPEGGARPDTSNVNFGVGQTVPNLAIVPVGGDGYVDLYNGSYGTVDLVADVTGYFTNEATNGYTPTPPARLLDTRYGVGGAAAQVGGNGTVPVQVAGSGKGNLPNYGITAVALNVTVTGPQGDGYLTVYPSGTDKPVASNVNYTSGQTIANAVVVPVGADGKIDIYNGSWGAADVVVDVVGYYSASGDSAFLPTRPTRLLDTRSASWQHGPLANGDYIYMPLGAGARDLTAFVLNTTVTDTQGGGYLTVSPDPNTQQQYQNGTASWPNRPLVSTLNWTPGQTVPNLVQANAGTNGIIDIWNAGTGSANLVVDAFGYYQND